MDAIRAQSGSVDAEAVATQVEAARKRRDRERSEQAPTGLLADIRQKANQVTGQADPCSTMGKERPGEVPQNCTALQRAIFKFTFQQSLGGERPTDEERKALCGWRGITKAQADWVGKCPEKPQTKAAAKVASGAAAAQAKRVGQTKDELERAQKEAKGAREAKAAKEALRNQALALRAAAAAAVLAAPESKAAQAQLAKAKEALDTAEHVVLQAETVVRDADKDVASTTQAADRASAAARPAGPPRKGADARKSIIELIKNRRAGVAGSSSDDDDDDDDDDDSDSVVDDSFGGGSEDEEGDEEGDAEGDAEEEEARGAAGRGEWRARYEPSVRRVLTSMLLAPEGMGGADAGTCADWVCRGDFSRCALPCSPADRRLLRRCAEAQLRQLVLSLHPLLRRA